MKLLIGGPKHSGKTCMREALRKLVFRFSGNRIYPAYLPANPDGDGRWYVETALRDVDRARDLRRRAKIDFTSAFAARVASAIPTFETPLLLIDMGGDPEEHDKQIVAGGTHAILLYKTPEDLKVWECWFQAKDMVAKLESILDPGADSVHYEDGVLRGTVHNLNLEHDCSDSEAVQSVARRIVELLQNQLATPPKPGTLWFESAPLAEHKAGAVINVSLDPYSEANPILVRKAWELALTSTDDLSLLMDAQLILINGPLTMAVAVALTHRIRSLAPQAELAIYDPEMGSNVSLELGGDEESVEPNPFSSFEISLRNGVCYVEVGLNTAGLPKEKLLQAAGNQLGKQKPPHPVGELRFSGRVPVALAAAVTLYLSDNNTRVLIEDPPSGGYIQTCPNP